MRKILIGLITLTSLSAFTEEVWCTDKAFSNSNPTDSAYTLRFNTSSERGYFHLVDRLFLALDEVDGKISIAVGKSGGPYSTWNPIAATDGIGEVTLKINRNSLANRIYLDGYDFPEKKLAESSQKYAKRLKGYLKIANGSKLFDAFNSKYGELLIIHCKSVKD